MKRNWEVMRGVTIALAIGGVLTAIPARAAPKDMIFFSNMKEQIICDAADLKPDFSAGYVSQVCSGTAAQQDLSYAYTIDGVCLYNGSAVSMHQSGHYTDKPSSRFEEITYFDKSDNSGLVASITRSGACGRKPWDANGKCELTTTKSAGGSLMVVGGHSILPNVTKALVESGIVVDEFDCNSSVSEQPKDPDTHFVLGLPTDGKRFTAMEGDTSLVIPVQVAISPELDNSKDPKFVTARARLKWVFIFDVEGNPGQWVQSVYSSDVVPYVKSKVTNIRYADLLKAATDAGVTKAVSWRVKANFIDNGGLGWSSDNTPYRSFIVSTMTTQQMQDGIDAMKARNTKQVEASLKLDSLDYSPKPLSANDLVTLSLGYSTQGVGTLKSSKVSITCQSLSSPATPCPIGNMTYDVQSGGPMQLQAADGSSTAKIGGTGVSKPAQPGSYRITAAVTPAGSGAGSPLSVDVSVMKPLELEQTHPPEVSRSRMTPQPTRGMPRTDTKPPLKTDPSDPAAVQR